MVCAGKQELCLTGDGVEFTFFKTLLFWKQFHRNLFQEHAKYYRDAMVRVNYADYAKGVDTEFGFWENFMKICCFMENIF